MRKGKVNRIQKEALSVEGFCLITTFLIEGLETFSSSSFEGKSAELSG